MILNNLFSFLKKEFVKNVLTLMTGSAISQLIIYVSILLLTRLFSPEFFGVYMLFSSSILVLKPIATLQYEYALVLPKKDEDAINLLCFSLLVLLCYTIILFLVISFFKDAIFNFFEISKLSNFVYLLPISVFLFGSISTFDFWNNRTNRFKNISKGLLIKSFLMSISQIATGFSSLKTLGLIPGMLLGQLAQLFFLVKTSFQSIIKLAKEISLQRMFFLAKKYKDIPIFNTIINFTNNLSNELPILLITKYFGLSYSGIFGLAVKFTKAPTGIIQQSVNQVFFNKATIVYNQNGNLNQLVKRTLKNLSFIGICILIPIFFLSFYLDFIFGDDWDEVGLYSRILIPWLFVMLLSSSISNLTIILNKQKTILVYDILLLISRFFAFYIGYHFYNDIIVSLLMYSSIGVIFNIFILVLFFNISKNENKTIVPYQ